MGVFKRYKDAQAAQKDAENAMPGAYQSNYTDRINEALDSMGAASNAGYDVGTDSELYRQYRAGAQANARAAAENAAAGAAALSGGYGSSSQTVWPSRATSRPWPTWTTGWPGCGTRP